jgi:hypothetical protein
LIDQLAPEGCLAPQGPEPGSELAESEARLVRARRDLAATTRRRQAAVGRLLRALPLILAMLFGVLLLLGGLFTGLYLLLGTRAVTYAGTFFLAMIAVIARSSRRRTRHDGVSQEPSENGSG